MKEQVKSFLKWKILSFVGIPTIVFFLCIILVVVIAGSELDKAAAVIANSEAVNQEETGDEETAGKATYVGVDDTETALSRAVIPQTRKWSNNKNPYYNGYTGFCELWCADIYRAAGRTYSGACCAYTHGIKHAKKSGKVPKGALIFSGLKPDGSIYENGHRASAFCHVCGHYAGHVAIYQGNGRVVGSQVPYSMSIDAWIEMFGYGGFSYN